MRIGAALLELHVAESDSLKARRRVARAIVERIRGRFGAAVADVGDQDDRHRIQIGCALVGVDPRHVRVQLEKIVAYVEGLGLAELVGEDLEVARFDELEWEEVDADDVARDWLRGEEGN